MDYCIKIAGYIDGSKLKRYGVPLTKERLRAIHHTKEQEQELDLIKQQAIGEGKEHVFKTNKRVDNLMINMVNLVNIEEEDAILPPTRI